MSRSRGEEIAAPDDVADRLQRVVDDDGEMIARSGVATAQNEIAPKRRDRRRSALSVFALAIFAPRQLRRRERRARAPNRAARRRARRAASRSRRRGARAFGRCLNRAARRQGRTRKRRRRPCRGCRSRDRRGRARARLRARARNRRRARSGGAARRRTPVRARRGPRGSPIRIRACSGCDPSLQCAAADAPPAAAARRAFISAE